MIALVLAAVLAQADAGAPDAGLSFVDDALPIRYASLILPDGGTRTVDVPLFEDGGMDLENAWTGMSPELTLHVAKAKAFGRAEDATLQAEVSAPPTAAIVAGATAITLAELATGVVFGYIMAKDFPAKK